jgi:hypothetical protein
MLQNVKKVLANTEPSTHGAKRPFDKVPTSANPKSAKAKRAVRFSEPRL